MLAPLLSTKGFGMHVKKKAFNSRYYMLHFPLFMAVTLEHYYLSTMEK